MKKSILSVTIIGLMLLFVTNTGFSQETTKEFKVMGNCNGCKKRIEKAALGVDGVSLAEWDKETKMIKVTMDEQVNIATVASSIEAIGHDTEFNKAIQTAYDDLPGCCQYDREDANTTAAKIVNTFSFKVSGNCGMCKKRIEKAAKTVSGIESAIWDKESKVITVETSIGTIGKNDVSKAIAMVGHDTEFDKADQTAYDDLPDCCQYDRNQ